MVGGEGEARIVCPSLIELAEEASLLALEGRPRFLALGFESSSLSPSSSLFCTVVLAFFLLNDESFSVDFRLLLLDDEFEVMAVELMSVFLLEMPRSGH